MHLETRPTALPGCLELRPPRHADARGLFVKTFHADTFAALGLPTTWAEQFYSHSAAGVLRGLHFQTPPHAHDKLVTCLQGRVWDVVLDLRLGSPTYGRHAVVELSAELGNELFIPAGLAHGFCTLQGTATLLYAVTTGYVPAADAGVRWDSAGIPWPLAEPLLSARDAALPLLADYPSPFLDPDSGRA